MHRWSRYGKKCANNGGESIWMSFGAWKLSRFDDNLGEQEKWLTSVFDICKTNRTIPALSSKIKGRNGGRKKIPLARSSSRNYYLLCWKQLFPSE
jgi:hypothetical protein